MEIEKGVLPFVRKGYVLAKDGEKFGKNTRTFAITNLHGEVIYHWATAVSAEDGKRTFLEWFKKEYPKMIPPFWENIFVFRPKKKVPSK